MRFIFRYWPIAGIIFAILILCYIYIAEKNKLPITEKLILLNLAFLMLHQFEEYVYPGGFKEYFNKNIYNPFGLFRNKLNDKGIFWINVVFGWGMNILVLLFFKTMPIAVLTVVAILFINGILHFAVTFRTQYYNPGVISGAILFLPLGLYAYYKLSPLYNFSYQHILIVFAFAGLLSFMIPITIFATRNGRTR